MHVCLSVCLHTCRHACVWFRFQGPWAPLYDTQVYNASGWTMPSITNSVIRCAFLPGPRNLCIRIYTIYYTDCIQKNILNIINAHNRYPHHPYRNKIKGTWTGMSQNVGWGVGRALRFHTMSFCVLQQSPSHISSDNTRLAPVWNKRWAVPGCLGLSPIMNKYEHVLNRTLFPFGCHYLSWPVALAATQMVPARIAESFPNKKKRLASRHIPEWGTFLGVLKSRPRLVRWCIVNINAKQSTQKTRYCEGPW